MKVIRLSIFNLFLILMLFLSNAVSQDYSQLGLPTGAKIRIGKGAIHGNITFSPDSSILAVANTLGIWLYDGYTGKEINLLVSNSGEASSVAFSPDGKTLASGHIHKFHFWDVTTGELKDTIKGHVGEIPRIAFSPDGKTFAKASLIDDTVKLWNVASGELQRSFITHPHSVECLTFSPDGKTLATAGYDEDGDTLKLWDVDTGKLKTVFTAKGFEVVTDIAYSPDGSTIASSVYWSSGIWLWDITTGTLRETIFGHVDSVRSVAYSPDGKTLASGSGDYTVCLWDSDGNYQTTLTDHTNTIVSVAFSPDGKTLASASWDGTIILRDTKTLQPRTTINGHISGFNSITFSPDGKTVVSGCEDKTVRLWDTVTGENRGVFRGHTGSVLSVAISPDGKTLASTGGGNSHTDWYAHDSTVRLWDIGSGRQKALLFGHIKDVYHVSYSPNGQVLVSSGSDKKAIFWDTATGNPLWTITGNVRTSRNSNLNSEGVGRVKFSPDGMMAVSGDSSGVSVWNTSNRQLITSFSGPTDRTSDIAFSPDGKIVATIYGNGEVHLYNITTRIRNIIPSGHTGRLSLIAFSPNGEILATADFFDGSKVRFWDPDSSELKSEILSPQAGIRSLAFSPTGNTLATASLDGTILLWDVRSVTNLSQHASDITGDGVLSMHDLMLVAANLGKTGALAVDVNYDDVVDIADLIKIAGELEIAAVKPELNYDLEGVPTIADVENWIDEARETDLTQPINLKGILFLKKLLHTLTPTQTALLANYPNPFNPETWIPYQLASPADVAIRIYSTNGKVIRTLDLGHQTIGLYHHRNSAAYWDGKNDIGETVASGVYFYTLTAGTFTATGKMLVRK